MSRIITATDASLTGRTVFVSGGATGIDEAFVRAYAAQDARVGFVDIDTQAISQVPEGRP